MATVYWKYKIEISITPVGTLGEGEKQLAVKTVSACLLQSVSQSS